MRVGFSLHREHRNKLPRGWVDSPDGPIRVRIAANANGAVEDQPAEDGPAPNPWNDDRPYLDLFRQESTVLRSQWLGGYWKLPIEDVNSEDLRGKIVSVAKQGTAPVPEYHLHEVYACLGNMVCELFGCNDISQTSLRARYKDFPEFSSFIIARLACSMRLRDKTRSAHILELAQLQIEKLSGQPRDAVFSYIHRNLGVAEAGHNAQWSSAAEYFKRSIEAMPSNANSRHLLGIHYLEQGELRKAEETWEGALLLDPDFKAPYACLGVVRLRLGEYGRAAEVSVAGLVRHPQTPACLYNLGVARFAMAYLQEQHKGGGYVASALRAKALEALEAARDAKSRDYVWEARDDAMVARLRDESVQIVWPARQLPQDGWRIMGWRP